jgi:hypothetical protein
VQIIVGLERGLSLLALNRDVKHIADQAISSDFSAGMC